MKGDKTMKPDVTTTFLFLAAVITGCSIPKFSIEKGPENYPKKKSVYVNQAEMNTETEVQEGAEEQLEGMHESMARYVRDELNRHLRSKGKFDILEGEDKSEADLLVEIDVQLDYGDVVRHTRFGNGSSGSGRCTATVVMKASDSNKVHYRTVTENRLPGGAIDDIELKIRENFLKTAEKFVENL